MKTRTSTAYSYIRFSTPEQSRGDSLRRQTESATEWCKRNGVTLDASRRLHDLGKSAYAGSHRANPDRNALAAFLKLVEDGKIARGSYLIVESLDRLTREHIRPALTLLLNLIEAGVRVVQLKPAEIIYDTDVEPMTLMMALMELSRGNSESRIKSERVGKAWQQKKELARQGKAQPTGMACLTRRLPAWIEERGGTLHLIPARAAVIRRMFHLAAAGYSQTAIVKLFHAKAVPTIGRGVRWSRSYVALILKNRRVLGEYQPYGRNHKPEGEPIPNYFPAVVTEKEWNAARAVASTRGLPPTRITDRVNLFTGLLKDARDGETGFFRHAGSKKSWHDVLLNDSSRDGRAPAVSFPCHVFESAVLQLLAEIDPREIVRSEAQPDETASLAGEISHVEAKIANLETALLDGDSPTVAKVLRQQEAKLQELQAKLAEARQKAAHPLADSWGETQTLAGILEGAEDVKDTRLRIRAALRRIVDSIWLLIVPRGTTRLAAVQMRFTGGAHRDYLIVHWPAKGNRSAKVEARWTARSVSWHAKSKGKGAELDMHDKRHVAELEAALQKIDLEGL
jgi:DNA invertase Pin-like site-specific DNA recombinase